ncbi:OmpA family protein [Caulobacter endophyticus]|uniref:OmpA family protein n=1 Tax=Caulobacter endophyticus TaxID=2172652 RepID=UPI002410074E|nr:OmpA family protein [Caulobacter endophyticus]MDG2528915.1 OmpA family protein [Caulobacter endophyticus]
MKTLVLGVALCLGFACGASAQERSAGEIERELKAAIAKMRGGSAPAAVRGLGRTRTIVHENGIDARRDPQDPLASRPAAATASAPAASQAPSQEAAASCVVATSFSKIYFDRGSAALSADPMTQQTLAQLADALALPDFEDVRFWIRGHTDSTGGAALNLALSGQRAANVARFMVASGVPAGRVRSLGRGSAEPADPAQPADKVNRRVDVCVEQKA